jgi:hypothetical protein
VVAYYKVMKTRQVYLDTLNSRVPPDQGQILSLAK